MATKQRPMRSVLRAVPKRVGKAQAEAEKALARGYRATLKALPAGPRKAVRELGEQLEATADELARRGKRTMTAVEKQGKSVAGRVEAAIGALEKQRTVLRKRLERLLGDIDKRRGRALNLAAKRFGAAVGSAERGLAELEKRAARAVAPLAQRFAIATQSDIAKLSKRLTQLERKLGRRGGKLAA